MSALRIGMVGAGRLGGFHAEKAAAHPRTELVGIYDPCEANRQRVAQKLGVKEFAQWTDFLSSIDAAVVATPSVFHFEMAEKLLKAGKHLLVEKPMTTTASQAQTLWRLASDQRLVLQAGHVEQYNPAWRAAQPFFHPDGGDSFELQEKNVVIEAVRASGYTFRSVDVGVVLDLMIHDLELVFSLISAPLESVCARGWTHFGGHEDTAFAELFFQNGSLARLTASRVEQQACRHMSVRSPTQSIVIDFQTRTATRIHPTKDVLAGKYAPISMNDSFILPNLSTFMQEAYCVETLSYDPVDALSLEMENFVGAVLDQTPSRVAPERVVRAIETAEMICQQIENSKRRSV